MITFIGNLFTWLGSVLSLIGNIHFDIYGQTVYLKTYLIVFFIFDMIIFAFRSFVFGTTILAQNETAHVRYHWFKRKYTK